MRKTLVVFFLIFIVKSLSAQIVSADSAKYFGDKIVSVKGIVMSTYETHGEKISQVLNFGKPYPDQVFQVIIYEKDLSKFVVNPIEFFKDKELTVRGKVKVVKGKPFILVDNPNQIVVK